MSISNCTQCPDRSNDIYQPVGETVNPYTTLFTFLLGLKMSWEVLLSFPKAFMLLFSFGSLNFIFLSPLFCSYLPLIIYIPWLSIILCCKWFIIWTQIFKLSYPFVFPGSPTISILKFYLKEDPRATTEMSFLQAE